MCILGDSRNNISMCFNSGEEYYNDWLMVRVRKDHLKHLIIKSDTHTYEVLKEENHKEGKT
jgi:hypothetical protein